MKRSTAGPAGPRAATKKAAPEPDALRATSDEALVRELMGRLASVDAEPPAQQLGRLLVQCLLEFEADGNTCLLVRVLRPPAEASRHALSPRELEIARMIARGHANKTIAAVLEISGWTVCTYLRRMFAKLGVTSRTAMIARLIEQGQLGDAAADADFGIPNPPRPRAGAFRPSCDPVQVTIPERFRRP